MLDDSAPRPAAMVAAVLGWAEVLVEAPAGFDAEKARSALVKKLDEVNTYLKQHQGRLSNPDFIAKATAETREQMEQRADELSGRKQTPGDATKTAGLDARDSEEGGLLWKTFILVCHPERAEHQRGDEGSDAKRFVPASDHEAATGTPITAMNLVDQLALTGMLDRALAEDVGLGDVTTAATVRPDARGRARITVKEDQIIFCGGPLIEPILARCGAQARIEKLAAKGRCCTAAT